MKALNKCVLKECIWNDLLFSNMVTHWLVTPTKMGSLGGGGGHSSLVLGWVNLSKTCRWAAGEADQAL